MCRIMQALMSDLGSMYIPGFMLMRQAGAANATGSRCSTAHLLGFDYRHGRNDTTRSLLTCGIMLLLVYEQRSTCVRLGIQAGWDMEAATVWVASDAAGSAVWVASHALGSAGTVCDPAALSCAYSICCSESYLGCKRQHQERHRGLRVLTAHRRASSIQVMLTLKRFAAWFSHNVELGSPMRL